MSLHLHALDLLRRHRVVQALLGAAGAIPSHLVGGVLRDRLLGLPVVDYDAVVERDGRAIAERLAAILPARLVFLGGKEFAAYRLVGAGFVLDLWDREGMSFLADLERRDFTVNALALDLGDGKLYDPHGGLADLSARVLRATTVDSFAGDPLRVLRLPRLLLQLPGFSADPMTLHQARAAAPRLSEVAAERVRDELARMTASPEAHRGLAILQTIGVYPGLWLGRPGEPGPTGHAALEMEHLSAAEQALRRAADGIPAEVDLPAARAAILFANLPVSGPAGGIKTRVQAGPAEDLRRFAAAGYIVRRDADRVAALLLCSSLSPESLRGEAVRRHFLHDNAELWPTAVAYIGAREIAAGRGTAWVSWLRELIALLRRSGNEILHPPALLTGDEVIALLGLSRGPAVGAALLRLRRAQVEGWVSTREQAIALLRAPTSGSSGAG